MSRCESRDLPGAEPALVLLAQFLLQSNDEPFDLLGPRLGDQRLRPLDFCQQLIRLRSAQSDKTWQVENKQVSESFGSERSEKWKVLMCQSDSLRQRSLAEY